MAVVIRLRRTGRKNRPCYRINVADSRFPRDGRMIETIGLYDPLRRDAEQQLVVDVERARHWIKQGARVTDVVNSIFRRKGVLEPKPRTKRDRSGRQVKKTATRTRRDTAQATREAAKTARHAERVKVRRTAKKAAKAAAAEPKA